MLKFGAGEAIYAAPIAAAGGLIAEIPKRLIL